LTGYIQRKEKGRSRSGLPFGNDVPRNTVVNDHLTPILSKINVAAG